MNQATLQRPSGRGKFITFEGGEGSGKSTQIKKLAERLDAAKLRAVVTREPGGSPGAEIIRQLLARATPDMFPASWHLRVAERHGKQARPGRCDADHEA